MNIAESKKILEIEGIDQPLLIDHDRMKFLWSLSLEEKEQYIESSILQFWEKMNGKVYQAHSHGLDSIILEEYLRQFSVKYTVPAIPKFYINTTNEFPSILEAARADENTTVLTSEHTFKNVVEKHGFPMISKRWARAINTLRHPSEKNKNIRNLFLTGYNRNGQYSKRWILPKIWKHLIDAPFDISDKCCNYLKHGGLEKYANKCGLCPYVGTLADDSQTRKDNYQKHGCNILQGKQPKSRPLSILKTNERLTVVNKYNLKINSIYQDVVINGEIIKGEHNTGCADCDFGLYFELRDPQDRYYRQWKRNPRFYLYGMDGIKNNGVTRREALRYVGFIPPDERQKTIW